MPTTTSVPQRVSPEVSTLGPLKRNSPQSGSRGRLTVKNNTSETMKKQIKKIFSLMRKKEKKYHQTGYTWYSTSLTTRKQALCDGSK